MVYTVDMVYSVDTVCFVLLKLLYTAKTLACMPSILLGKVRTVLKLEVELLSKMPDERMGE